MFGFFCCLHFLYFLYVVFAVLSPKHTAVVGQMVNNVVEFLHSVCFCLDKTNLNVFSLSVRAAAHEELNGYCTIRIWYIICIISTYHL